MTEPLTYNGLDVPIWEERWSVEEPRGDGWTQWEGRWKSRSGDTPITEYLWRRPHPFRELARKESRSTAARMFDAMADGDPAMALAQIAEDVAGIRGDVERVREYAQWTYEATR